MNRLHEPGSLHALLASLPTRLEPTEDIPEAPGELRHAAVVALLTECTADHPGPGLVLTERARSLRSHGGQVSFPGGKPEPADDSLLTTALREAAEEVGLTGETRVLGRLNPVPTPTGFFIIPFVGVPPRNWSPRPTSSEVHTVLHTPLEFLLDEGRHTLTGRVQWEGRGYDMHEFDIGGPRLWGATARMVWDLMRRIRGEAP